MNRVKLLSLILIAATSLLLSACGSTERVRYKMVVEVETPEGLRTGSAVREVSYVHASPLAIFTKDGVWVEGEAVAVDLPGERMLFSLLESDFGSADFGSHLPIWLMGWRKPEGIITEPIELWPSSPLNRIGAARDGPIRDGGATPAQKRPMLVTFRDLSDPMSIMRVEPSDLAAHFGEGVRLRRITVQVTKEDVTTGLNSRLPWLNNLEAYRASVDNPFTSTLPEEIGSLRRL